MHAAGTSNVNSAEFTFFDLNIENWLFSAPHCVQCVKVLKVEDCDKIYEEFNPNNVKTYGYGEKTDGEQNEGGGAVQKEGHEADGGMDEKLQERYQSYEKC